MDNLSSVVVNGVSLAYRQTGNGEALVIINGGASDVPTWRNQEVPMGTRYRIIAYSRRYARPNSSIDDGLDDQMDPHVEDLVSLLGALNIERAHLSTSRRAQKLLNCLGSLRRRPKQVARDTPFPDSP